MKSKLKSVGDIIHSVKYVMGFIWNRKYGKSLFIVKYIYAFISAVLSNVYIIIPGLLINALMDISNLKKILFFLVLVLVFPVVQQLLSLLFDKRIGDIHMKLELVLSQEYYNHIADMDYETLENPEIQMMQELAEQTLNDAASVVDKTSGLLSAVVSLAAITSIISTLNPLIIVLICVIIFVNSWMTKRMNAKSFALGKKLDREFRFQAFYPYALTCLEYAKEIRVFHLKSYLIGLFSDSVEKSNAIVKERRKDGRHLSLFTVITAMIQQIAVYSFCVFNVVARGLSIGTMTIYLSATGQFASALNSVFQSFLTFSYDSLAIREMIDFFNIPQKQHETGSRTPVFTKDSVIEFRHVYFRYPGNERYVIEDLNLVIRGDEKLCIVGVNGSGKSTFIKLLIRLYFPEKGEILLNGINIMEYDYKKYMRIFAPVFQDFAVYSMTLKQNIVLADAFDGERLKKVCRNSGIDQLAEKQPKGYDVRVDRGKEEDSIQLSGGEGQRMAISRACYHGGEVFLLDEPTAALDPMAEYEIYTQFNNMITDKCAVLITHRLSAVQLADKVAVFDSGHVVEYGTHAELYANGGIYTEMFDKQAQFYRDEITQGNDGENENP